MTIIVDTDVSNSDSVFHTRYKSICTWYKMTGLKKSFVPGDLDRMIGWADDNILNGEKFEAIKSDCLQELKTGTSYICNEQTITIKHHGKDLGVYE